jgi:hypothetical protein
MYVKLFEAFHEDLEKERAELTKKGEFKIYIGTEENVRKFFNNLTEEATPYAKINNDANQQEVRIYFPKDMDIVHELQDVAEMCGLAPLDVNSVTN